MKRILALLLVFSILVPVLAFASKGTLYASKKQPQITTPDGKTIYYKYDSGNRLTEIITDAGSFKFTYDIVGRRTKLQYPNGVTATYKYDSVSLLTSLLIQDSQVGTLASVEYSYDKVGNILEKAEADTKYAYTYDAIYRLTQAIPTKLNGKDKAQPNKAENYDYDPVGNRTLGPDANDYYSYDQANRLLSDRKHQYQYDNNGNLIRKTPINSSAGWTYSYDYENRLIRAIKKEAGETKTTTFKYDPFGKRIEKSVEEKGSTKTYKYFYDEEDIIFEELTKSDSYGTRSETSTYIHGPGIDEPLAVIRNGEVYYYHADGQGSIIALTDSRGKVVQRYEYDSFGNVSRYGDKVKQPYAYIGREWDKETGLYYFRARYYDPVIGRYLTKDPSLSLSGDPNTPYLLHQQLRKPQELNPYTYARNNPVTYSDPSGLFVIAPAITACLSNPECVGALLAGGALLIQAIRNLPPPQCRDNREECEEQYENDSNRCRSLTGKYVRNRCWRSAMDRYVACRSGLPIPPLITWP